MVCWRSLYRQLIDNRLRYADVLGARPLFRQLLKRSSVQSADQLTAAVPVAPFARLFGLADRISSERRAVDSCCDNAKFDLSNRLLTVTGARADRRRGPRALRRHVFQSDACCAGRPIPMTIC